ncbi:MAG: Nif3-like dinuclear metal center hexameric protein [Vicingaceae bacterium]
MTSIGKVISVLEKMAPLNLQENYDNSGLLCGNKSDEVNGILVSLDCTEEVLEEAIDKGCNLIVSHHPILFKPISKLTGEHYVERCLIKAVQNNLALYAIHTNLDSVPDGVNGAIADKLALVDRSILRPIVSNLRKLAVFCPESYAETVRNTLFENGAGHIGNYDRCSFNSTGTGTFRAGKGSNPFVGKEELDHLESEIKIEVVFRSYDQGVLINSLLQAHPYEEVAYDIYFLENEDASAGMGMIGNLPKPVKNAIFLKLLKDLFGTKVIKYTSCDQKFISKVAICGGSGSFLIKDALKAGADAFVTGDIKYHDFFEADSKMMLTDIGHFESEQFTTDLLVDVLSKNFTTFATHFSTVQTNPINYF